MALFKKKADPISERALALNAEIAGLEAEIKRLDSKLQRDSNSNLNSNSEHPRLRSTALPHGATVHRIPEPGAPPINPPVVEEPIFEEVDQNRLKAREETPVAPEHFNDLGVRKYDLLALVQKIRSHFRGPSTTNPKLVNYLAAGGIQGLRPLRYEKRVARNRFFALVAVICVVLLGIILAFVKRH
jgi:hypothetical protein